MDIFTLLRLFILLHGEILCPRYCYKGCGCFILNFTMKMLMQNERILHSEFKFRPVAFNL